MSVNGLDISKWQATTPPLGSMDFLFARATYGTNPDLVYPRHIKAARAAGLIVGAYHFGTGASSGERQAAAFLEAAGSVDLYVLDLETNGGGVNMSAAQARAFIAAVKATGRKVGLYHSDSGFPSLGQDFNWVAKWSNTPPSRPYAFWQFRGSPLDLDRFNGDLAGLKALAGRRVPAPITHYRATTTQATALWNPRTKVWVFNGSHALKRGTVLSVRARQFKVGPKAVAAYPVAGPAPYGGYLVPVANVKRGGKVP